MTVIKFFIVLKYCFGLKIIFQENGSHEYIIDEINRGFSLIIFHHSGNILIINDYQYIYTNLLV